VVDLVLVIYGAVAHGDEKRKHMTAFGPYPKRVVLLDGVFLAIKRKVFEKLDLMKLAHQNGIFMI
jgi:hypothetical protein